jgi:hypothetical protein
MARTFSAVALGAFLTVLGSGDRIWADDPTAPTAPAVVAPASPGSPVKGAPIPTSHVSLRDKLFHRPLFTHSKVPCLGCSSADDPDMGCSTCHSEWVFLFGSCRAFYNEPFYNDPFYNGWPR